MKRKIGQFLLILVCLLFAEPILTQNLVPNPSFELNHDCPDELNDLVVVDQWFGTSSTGVPDYYHTCGDPVAGFTVPDNWAGFQEARSGDAYIGMVVHKEGINIHEYAQTQLTQPLKAGACYEFKMYISVMELSECAINNIGVHFSNGPITPQIINQTNEFVDDNTVWTEIIGYYQSNGGEKFITIGNFFDHSQTLVKAVQ